jgi:hypothetical protein
MSARAIIYNPMIIGAMLLAGCSHDDVTIDITPSEPVAISFMPTLSPTLAEGEETTRAGQPGVMNSEDLRTTGFGVFASLNENKTPDMMFNQEVKFTFVGDIDKPDPDDPLKGYWSYQPLKYWPTGLTSTSNFYISAYAPYQNLPIDPSGTGIIGISANNEAPYIDYRRCEKPDEMVDLLWYYDKPNSIPAATSDLAAGTQKIEMRHALARLEINVALASNPGTTKVLIEEITLKGKMAKTGRLSLSTQETAIETVIENEVSKDVTRYYPVWSNQTYEDRTITIKNDDNDADSYGIIDPQVRYIKDLPYAWQPAGLSTAQQNALSTSDRKTYIYLIPQPAATPEVGDPTGLDLKVEVKYQKWASGASSPEAGVKSIDTSPVKTPITVGSPLKGSTPYALNITLSDI